MQKQLDVALVGYGPVGQTLAILLGQRGWKVGVFEKQATPYPLPRAVHFDHEVARILQGAGLGGELPRLSGLEPDLAAYLASIGGVGAHVAPAGPIQDVSGSYRRWFAEHGVAVALVRPDFHIFGTARAVGGAGKLVAALQSALGSAR
jgi:hypothetical protein